jgi:NAD+ kinase
LITPICPHTLTNRPLVDSAECTFTLTAPEALEGTMLVIDGQIKLPLAAGDRVDIRRAPVKFQMAKLPGSSYYDTLHRKLGWGGQTNYPA